MRIEATYSVLEKPIIVLGAARSGTKVIPRVLRQHPDVAVWSEPNYIWKYGNARLGHDMIPADRATPEITAYIRDRFRAFTLAQGRTRFCEKTPANSLRLPFVLAVLPGAKLIHVIRDGRDVALSARERWLGRGSDFEEQARGVEAKTRKRRMRQRIKKKLGNGEIPIRDFPYYVPRFVSSYFNRVGLKKRELFGPRFPGIEDLMRDYSLLEVCALQWRWCVEGVLNCVAQLGEQVAYHEVKYEELCRRPEVHLPAIYDFLELTTPRDIDGVVAHVKGGNVAKWKHAMTEVEQARVAVHIGYLLRSLGYEL